MKIKNVQQYRSFYKTSRAVSNELEEHFIGNYYFDEALRKKKYGWFTMYHGDKDGYGDPATGIENFLQSFLDMAKDGQAVYEFLQNAVDASSTHYTMIWGQDEEDGNHYLLVANNGKMFDVNSIRSILNVGSSTKTADSQTIGKFGIGFKLAHRLVGKNNGLEELIHENSGPLLFSWKNYEIAQLADGSNLIPVDVSISTNNKGDISIADDNPWLFKILITCFPCLPENELIKELPRMADGVQSKTAPFSTSEYKILSRWVKNNLSILTEDTYNEGALFFIKLGSGKETELAENNLKEGVKFALAILKETADTDVKKRKILSTVQLNNEEAITYPDLEYIKLTIDKQTERDTYAYIRFGTETYNGLLAEQKKKITEEANIEALFGFRKHNEIGEYFKGAPNFYLYFPLSEEVHNFNYILHSNAFYKGSSRTFLHKGSSKEDGINERLLKTIVDKIDAELSRLSSSDDAKDRQLFLHFYAALLTSAKSTNQDRLWIEDPYINRINKLLKKYIPVRSSSGTLDFRVTDKPEKVFIKKTKIEINTKDWGIENVNWFYWDDNAESSILSAALLKLGVKEFTIYNLLSLEENISTSLNNWIGESDTKIKTILSEVALLDTETVKQPTFKKNLFDAKLLKFNNSALLSIVEFQEKEKEGYFIVFNKLTDIKDLLQKLDLHYTFENFDDYNFNPKYFSFFANDSQVKSYIILTRLFSQVVKDDKLNALNKLEKHRIFDAFRTFNETPGERMGELKLFKNNNLTPVKFKNLYSNSAVTWLNKFCINSSDDDPAYKNYLLSKTEELYQGIIYPFWAQIAAYIATNPNKAKEVLDDFVNAYEKSTWSEKQKYPLSSWNQVVFKSEVIQPNKILFNAELQTLKDEEFKSIQTTTFKYFGVHIPDKYLLPYLGLLPFSFSSAIIHPTIEDSQTSSAHIIDLLMLSKLCNLDFFGSNCILLIDGVYYINSTAGKKQIATTKSEIVKYIETYYPDEYVLVPEQFVAYKSKIELSDSRLVEHFIDRFDESNLKQELDFIEVILSERYDDKKALLKKLTYTNLDATWTEERQNELYIKLLREVAEGNATVEELSEIHKKISINRNDQEIIIGNIDSAHDSVEVLRGDKKITLSQSQILNLDNADNIKLIQAFHDEAKKRSLLNPSTADKLFKISNAGISSELVAKFYKKLKEKQLDNVHQLLFVWLSGKFKKEEFSDFSLKSQDNIWYKLEGQIIVFNSENSRFIHPIFIANESYTELQSLLQLSDLEVFNYGSNEDDIIASHFLFVKGFEPSILESTEGTFEKLNYLQKGLAKVPFNSRDYKGNAAWGNFLSISPNQYVLNGIQTEEEILPEEFLTWYQSDGKKTDLLRAIGVNVNDSYLEKFRKYLLGVTKEYPAGIELHKFNNSLLLNTMNGLSGDFKNLEGQSVIYNELQHHDQLSLLEKIINYLESSKVEQYPVLIYVNTSLVKVLRSDEPSIYRIDEELHCKLKEANGNLLTIVYEKYNVLKQIELLNVSIIENVEELKFRKTFVPTGNQIEHDEPFYHTWKTQNNIRLFKETDLNFDVAIEIDENLEIIGRVVEGDYVVMDDVDGYQTIYYRREIHLEDLSLLLETEKHDLSDSINNLISRKDAMLLSIYNAYNSADKDNISNEHLQALQAAFKEEDLKQERKSLIDEIKTSSKYSHCWFESYLKYLLTFSSEQESTKLKTIRFQSIKRQVVDNLLSSKYYLLCGSSSYVSDSIEDISDFSLSITLNNSKKNEVKIEGAQKRGQDLSIFCPTGFPKEVLENLNTIIHLEITFIPRMNLLKELKNAFVNTSFINNWEDIKATLPNLQFIYGPPGTGKTTTLCSMIIDGVKADYNAKYLLLTPTNKAADVLCKKLLRPSKSSEDKTKLKLEELAKEGKSLSIIRIGKATDPELEVLEEEIYQDIVSTDLLDYTHIIASTVHRIPYTTVRDDKNDLDTKLFKLKEHWDYVIFDEASMTHLPYLVFAILSIHKFSPNAKFIIAGDPKQIPPVVDVSDKELEELDIQDENIYTMMRINSFKEEEQIIRPGDTIQNLSTQYRSVKKIGQLFSDLSYSKLLHHDRERKNSSSKELPEAFKRLISNNVTFIDVPLNGEDSIFKVKQLFYSSYHIYSAIFIAELVKYFDSVLKEGESWTVGLIAPYKAQAILMNKLITSFGISDKLKVYSDTVHGFQGDECDIVFFLSNPNGYRYSGHPKCLLSKEYIYNVAISRAKDYLIILHPFEIIKDNPFINSIRRSYSTYFESPLIQRSSEFETKIFGKKDYIGDNSYITGHDSVNVFGQIEKKYFIKANESAIDIQLRQFY